MKSLSQLASYSYRPKVLITVAPRQRIRRDFRTARTLKQFVDRRPYQGISWEAFQPKHPLPKVDVYVKRKAKI
jgi:hypothetical protein